MWCGRHGAFQFANFPKRARRLSRAGCCDAGVCFEAEVSVDPDFKRFDTALEGHVSRVQLHAYGVCIWPFPACVWDQVHEFPFGGGEPYVQCCCSTQSIVQAFLEVLGGRFLCFRPLYHDLVVQV